MSKLLTEQKALKKLGVADFTQLTKDNVFTLAPMLGRMDQEVAKKALEQFPDFSDTVNEMLGGYKETLDKAIASNKDSVQSYYDACNSIIKALEKLLENENLSFEERKYIIDKLFEISRKMGEKDSENKRFLAVLATIGAVAVGAVTVTLAYALGGNTSTKRDATTEDIDDGYLDDIDDTLIDDFVDAPIVDIDDIDAPIVDISNDE